MPLTRAYSEVVIECDREIDLFPVTGASDPAGPRRCADIRTTLIHMDETTAGVFPIGAISVIWEDASSEWARAMLHFGKFRVIVGPGHTSLPGLLRSSIEEQYLAVVRFTHAYEVSMARDLIDEWMANSDTYDEKVSSAQDKLNFQYE